MNATAAYGLLAHGLIFGALVALLPLGEMRARAALAATALAMAVGIAPAMHGFFGTPSLTLLLLATLQLAGRPAPLGELPARGLRIALWWKRQDVWLLILTLDLAAYAGDLFANLWDALFDPLLVLLALIVVSRPWATRLIASRNR